ncbi:hypothetical protein HN51_031457 [Arachis hypogaea]
MELLQLVETAVYSSELLLNGIIIQKLEPERHQLFVNQVTGKRPGKSEDVWTNGVVESATKVVGSFLCENGSLSSTCGMSNDTK